MQYKEDEKKCIRIIAKWFSENKRYVKRSEAIKEFGVDDDRYEVLIRMMEHLGVVTNVGSIMGENGFANHFRTSAYAEELAREFDEEDKKPGEVQKDKPFKGLSLEKLKQDNEAVQQVKGEGASGFKNERQLSSAFRKYLIEKRKYPPDSVSHIETSIGEEGRIIYLLQIIDKKQEKILAMVGICLDVSGANATFWDMVEFKKTQGISGVRNYVIFSGKNESIVMFEYGDGGDVHALDYRNFPDYEELRIAPSPDVRGGVFKSNEELRNAFEKFMVSEKGYPKESLSAVPYLGEDEYRPDCVTEVKGVEGKCLAFIAFCLERSGANEAFNDIKECKKNQGVSNVSSYVVFADQKQDMAFTILEDEDEGEENRVLAEDFPTYDQLLFASPLSDPGRRICWALIRLAKNIHGLSVHVPCQDYINLRIKKNKRTAAQIHRLNDSDKNIALVLAGYQEVFPDSKSEPYMVRGEISHLSGNTSEHPREIAWLNGNVNHDLLRYRAGVYIIKSGSLFFEDIEKEVGDLLELARKNAGGGIIKEFISKILKVFGRIATLRSDEVSDVDDLGREVLIDVFADTLIKTGFKNGFTFALMGNWGEGKSSVMEILKRKLREREKGGFDFALFNAWEYEQTDNVAAGMAQEVVKGLKGDSGDSLFYKIINWFHRMSLAILFNIIENRRNHFRFVLCGATSWFLYKWLKPHGINFGGDEIVRELVATGLVGFGGFVTLIYLFKTVLSFMEHPLPANLEKYFKLPNYAKHLGLVPVLKRHIRTLCMLKLNAIRIPFTKTKIGKDRKLLVLVDDLDRCKSEYIAETLDAIRLVMPIPNVIVMICIDHRIAFKAVEKHYRALAEEGDGNKRSSAEVARDYLGKIIQLPVRLEPVQHNKLKKYVYEKLFLFKKKEWEQFKEPSGAPKVTLPKDTSTPSDDKDPGPGTSERGKGITIGAGGGGQILGESRLNVDGTSKPQPEKGEQGRKPEDKKSNDIEIKDRPEEGKEFYRLAGLFEFTNPRQLLRLHNSFRFLKALARGGDKNTLDMLKMLFWQEFLHNWPMKVRGRCMAALVDETQVEEVTPEARGVLRKVKSDFGELFNNEPKRYEELAKFVRVVVLPHNEEGVLDTAKDITEWLEQLKKEEEKTDE